MLFKRKNAEYEIKSNESFGRGWTTLPGYGVDVYLIEATLTKEIMERKTQEVASI